MDAMLTRARRSVWEALDHWPALEGVFKKTWRFEDGGAPAVDPVPSFGDLPALALEPAPAHPMEWTAHQFQQIVYRVEAILWTRHWSLPEGERLWEEIVKAVHQSAPVGGLPYIATGTGQGGVELGPLKVERRRLERDGPPCVRWTWTMGLMVRWNPITAD